MEKQNSLRIGPIQASGAKESSCGIMVESTVSLLVAIKRRHERNALQGNPIDDSAFKTFGVIRPRTVSALLQLVKCQIDRMGRKCSCTKLAMCLMSCSEVSSSAKRA